MLPFTTWAANPMDLFFRQPFTPISQTCHVSPISFNTGETCTHFPTKTRSRISPSPVPIFSSLTSAGLMPCYQKPPKTMRSKLFDSTRVTTHKCPLRQRTCDLWCKLTDQNVEMAGSRTYASKLWIATMPGTFAPRIALRGGRGVNDNLSVTWHRVTSNSIFFLLQSNLHITMRVHNDIF